VVSGLTEIASRAGIDASTHITSIGVILYRNHVPEPLSLLKAA
jgi:hypothetical protein